MGSALMAAAMSIAANTSHVDTRPESCVTPCTSTGTPSRAIKCECGALRQPHRACASCGKYNGKVVLDVAGRAAREARRMKRREKELRASGQSTEKKASE